MSYTVSVDLGGTSGRVGAIDPDNPTVIVDRTRFAMTEHTEEMPGDFRLDYWNLQTAISRLIDRNGAPKNIGLAMAGNVNDERTTLTAAGNLGHWVEQEFVADLARTFSVPVFLGNDAEAAARAEAFYGHGQGIAFWSLIWGTGFGGTLVARVGRESAFLPGEPGHQWVDPGFVQCGCGQYGCLEAFVGGKGIANRFGRPAEELRESEWDDVVANLAVGVQNLVVSSLISVVVFSGGIACKQPHRLQQAEKILRNDLTIVDPPILIVSAFGEDAGLVGAATLPDLTR